MWEKVLRLVSEKKSVTASADGGGEKVREDPPRILLRCRCERGSQVVKKIYVEKTTIIGH